MGDNIWLDDRHGCRTPMQWSAAQHAGFSEAERTYQPVIDQPPYDYRTLNVAAQENDPDSTLALTRFLIATRQAQPALRGGALGWVETDDVAVLAFQRTAEGAPPVLCLFNLSDSARPGITPQTDMRDLLAREGRVYPAGQPIALSPFAAHWLVKQ